MFILRRSAGFAYSFVSLLRSEPANCKVTLLPLAMNVLLGHIERGLDDVEVLKGGEEGLKVEEIEKIERKSYSVGDSVYKEETTGSWRICVHALNVVRMILVDAVLSPELDRYIAQAAELAVRGFQSKEWAVRNSSMMVFASVIQRSVDNDKNESGGPRAATGFEFFQRFPSLYFFLLKRLGYITGYIIECKNGWPVRVIKNELTVSADNHGRGSHQGGLHPSLYPILLLLSKMRAAADTEEIPQLIRPTDISLFVKLVESCRGQTSQKVR